ncbi:MAG: transcriptional repressor [Corallococcus sp.]|nr:transcriptional repressor [Corallococcus sp.]
MRYSQQRQAIYEAVRSSKSHPDAYCVYAQVRKSMPNVSLGTVYRNLSELADAGKIKRISAVGNVERYDGTVEPHAHLVCRICGTICDAESIEVRTEGCLHGFDAQSAEVMIYGVCADCKNKNFTDKPSER